MTKFERSAAKGGKVCTRRPRLLAVFNFACGILATSCADTSVITIFNDGGGAGRDVTSEESVREKPACHACIVAPNDPGPGCGQEMDLCVATPFCAYIYECAYANGCVFKRTQGESIGCAFPCAKDITQNAYDEAIRTALALTTCFHAQCRDACTAEP
jgi:hypothetical protein